MSTNCVSNTWTPAFIEEVQHYSMDEFTRCLLDETLPLPEGLPEGITPDTFLFFSEGRYDLKTWLYLNRLNFQYFDEDTMVKAYMDHYADAPTDIPVVRFLPKAMALSGGTIPSWPKPLPLTSGENKPMPLTSGENKPLPLTSGENKPLPLTSGENKPLPLSTGESRSSSSLLPLSSGETKHSLLPLSGGRVLKDSPPIEGSSNLNLHRCKKQIPKTGSFVFTVQTSTGATFVYDRTPYCPSVPHVLLPLHFRVSLSKRDLFTRIATYLDSHVLEISYSSNCTPPHFVIEKPAISFNVYYDQTDDYYVVECDKHGAKGQWDVSSIFWGLKTAITLDSAMPLDSATVSRKRPHSPNPDDEPMTKRRRLSVPDDESSVEQSLSSVDQSLSSVPFSEKGNCNVKQKKGCCIA
jgi:hypothetical protein